MLNSFLTVIIAALALTRPDECDETDPYGQDGCRKGTTCALIVAEDGAYIYGAECVPLSCFFKKGDDPSKGRPLFAVEEDLQESCAEYAAQYPGYTPDLSGL